MESIPKESNAMLVRLHTNLPLLAILAATMYSLGWISETLLYSHLGIGEMSLSHEQAIAAGVATLVCLAPHIAGLLGGNAWKEDISTKVNKAAFQIAVGIGFISAGLFFFMKDGHYLQFQQAIYPNRSFYSALLIDAVLGVFGAWITFNASVQLRHKYKHSDTLFLIAFAALILKWMLFSNHILPCLSRGLGGFANQDVYIAVKSDSGICNPLVPCRIQGFLLAQDKDATLIAHGFRENGFVIKQGVDDEDRDTSQDIEKGRIYRIATSEILWMRQPTYSMRVFRKR